MKTKVNDLVAAIEHSIPLSIQESYDNSGLLVGNKEAEIEGVLICIDYTHEIIDEALSKNCNVIICHHPIIFNPLKSILGANENLLVRTIRSELNVYALHTGFDLYEFGTSYGLANRLGLTNITSLQSKENILRKLVVFVPDNYADMVRKALFDNGAGHIGRYDQCSFNLNGSGTFKPGEGANPFTGSVGQMHVEKEIRIETVFPAYLQHQIVSAMIKAHPYEEVAYDIYEIKNEFQRFGYGMLGNLPQPLRSKDFMQKVKQLINNSVIRHNTFDLNQEIERIAVMGGAGAFIIKDAIHAGAHVLVTADLKYHDFQLAGNSILLMDIGHYESEVYAKERIKDFLSKKFPNFAFLISETDTNFVRYF